MYFTTVKKQKTTNIPNGVTARALNQAPPPIEHGCPCPTQRNAGPHAYKDTPSESDTCPWRRGTSSFIQGLPRMVGQVVRCTRVSGRLAPSQGTLAGQHPSVGRGTPSKHTRGCHLAQVPDAGGCHRGQGALVPFNRMAGAVCRLSPCAVPCLLWRGCITELLPLRPELLVPSNSTHRRAFPGKFQLLVIDSSGELGRRSGAYTPQVQQHTHTDTHTWPLCQQGLPCVPPSALQHLSLQTLGQMRGYRGPAFLGLIELCTDAQQSFVYAATRGHSTQGHPGSSWQHARSLLPTHVQDSSLWTQLLRPGHSRPQHPTVRQSQTPRHPGTTHSSRADTLGPQPRVWSEAHPSQLHLDTPAHRP